MASRWRSISGLLSPLLVILLGALQPACYKPNILDGGLKCADAGAKACPEGYRCDRGLCWKNADGGVESRPEVLPDVVEARDGGDASDVSPECFEAVPGCTQEPGLCDPACQSGCSGCREKCSINTVGALTCNPPTVSMFPRTLMQSCTPESEGTGQQTDNCAPGLVCLGEQSCFNRCFQFCKRDSDCTNASCSREIIAGQGGQKVCDVPFVDSCVPSLGNTGCGGGTMACWLSSSSPTHTFCDCPFGATPSNGPCTHTRDCVKGLACVDRGTGEPATCLQVCRLGSMECPSGNVASCRQYFGNPRGTMSHPTFGYCY